VTVAERIEKFYDRYPEGRIITHIVEHDAERGFILMRAEGYRAPDDATPAATGHAFELRSEGYVNRTSYIENCESSCVGRMLALLGFEVRRGIASREEMEKATRNAQQEPPARERARPAPAPPAAPVPAAAEEAPKAPAKSEQLATEEQKQAILNLLEECRPGDRRAQRKLLTESTGKESRDDLTEPEARSLIYKLKREASRNSI
jgi:type IV secretory pathway VirB10-like protein